MLALGLAVLVFLFCGVLGSALLALLPTRRNVLQNLLLAPTLGQAAVLLLVFSLNRVGVPVGRFGAGLTLALVLASAGVLWRRRPLLPWRAGLPFAATLALALVVTGRPMLDFGFDWVSYANDDMANYSLAAQRFVEHGFFDVPDLNALVDGRDYTLNYWFFNVPGLIRPGDQLVLAWVVSLTGLTTHQAFMPLILAFHLMLISAAGALVYQSCRFRPAALLTCLLLSLSALTTLGVLYQLIAQVIGLAFLIGCLTLLLRPFPRPRATGLGYGLLAGLLGAALLIQYQEVYPFLVLAFVVYTGLGVARRQLPVGPLGVVIATAVMVALLVLNTYALGALAFLLNQTQAGLGSADVLASRFPYFLVPSGLAALWGFQHLINLSPEPWLSTSIALGGLLLLVSLSAMLVGLRRGHPVAAPALVMLALGVRLSAQNADFGLFKLAMYIQPFLLGSLAVAWLGGRRPRLPAARVGPLLLLGLAGVYTQYVYVEQSRGTGGSSELPNASRSHLNAEFRSIVASRPAAHIVLDSAHIVLAKFQSLYVRGTDASFPSRNFWRNILGERPETELLNPTVSRTARSLIDAVHQRLVPSAFDLHDPADPSLRDPFTVNMIGQVAPAPGGCLFVATTGEQSLINRRAQRPGDQGNFTAQSCAEVRDRLIFVHSELGQHYYFGEQPNIALYQLEPDLFFPGRTMAGLGRYLLFEVFNPSDPVRLELDMTATLKADADNRLPPAAAIGTERAAFGLVGRGAARVFSRPLTPQVIDGRSYVAIDMGVDGQLFPEKRTGLMNLYGADVLLDPRRLVGFGRDISLVSDAAYGHLTPPSALRALPGDLAQPDLVYSGLYEDGWVAEAAFIDLAQPEGESTSVRVRGSVPLIQDPTFTTQARVLVDGTLVAQHSLAPGEFDLRAAVSGGAGRRRVEVRFSAVQHLPDPDNRPAAAHLEFIGFEGG